jgi:mono/diheme cytochrome c family protein
MQVFRAHCVRCHDHDGRGESIRDLMRKIPDFTDPGWHVVRSDDGLARSVLHGKGKMPSMKQHLSGVDIATLIRLVRRFQGGTLEIAEDEPAAESAGPPRDRPSNAAASPGATANRRDVGLPTSPAAGAARVVYQRFCASCHGPDGRSAPIRPSVPSAPDFTLPGWHAERAPARLKISILEGRGSRMPSFQGKIADGQVEALVGLLRSFSGVRVTQPSNSLDDFDHRFERLMNELDKLKRRYYEPTPRISSTAKAHGE